MLRNTQNTAIGLLLFLPLLVAGCQPKEIAAPEQTTKAVQVQSITAQTAVTNTLSASGTVRPKQFTSIRSLTPGTIEYLVPVGTMVKAGDSLFSISDANIENNYFLTLQNYQQNVTLADQRLNQARLVVNSAEARLRLAEKTLTTAEQQNFQNVVSTKNTARVSYLSAYNSLQQIYQFLTVGTITNHTFRYAGIVTTQTQLANNTELQYQNTVRQFENLPTEPNPDQIAASLDLIYESLTETKKLIDNTTLLLQSALGVNSSLAIDLATDRATIATYQTQINAHVSTVLGNLTALENVFVGNEIASNQAQNAFALAEIEYQNAEIALKNATESAGLEKRIAQSQLNAASYSYNNLSLASPFSGTILSHNVTIGEQMQPGQAILELGDLEIVEITVAIDSSFAMAVKIGDEVVINGAYKGLITEVEPTGNITSGKIGVTIQSDSDELALAAGQTAEVIFTLNYEIPNSIIIPLNAVTIEASGNSVLVVENGIAAKRSVSLGQVYGNQVTVTSGLREGDQVILATGVFVTAGETVTIQQ